MNVVVAQIERITDIDGIAPLANVAREEGFDFLDRLLAEWAEGVNRFDRPDEILFGAYVSGRLVGTGGLTRQGSGLGRVRRVYVDPEFRRRGVARALIGEVLAFGRGHYTTVVLFTNPTAAQFYEQLGFVPENSEGPDHATHRLVLCPQN